MSIQIATNISDSILFSTRQLENQALSGTIEKLLDDLGEGHRYILRGNYKIIYKIQNTKIYITDIFDTRRNPTKMQKKGIENIYHS